MYNTYENWLLSARQLTEDGQYETAIEHYEGALASAQYTAQQIDVRNYLGRLYQITGATETAIQQFQASLTLHEQLPEEQIQKLSVNRAVVLNNLGTLFAGRDPQQTIEYHKAALQILEEQDQKTPDTYTEYLANTHYSLGGAYLLQSDVYQANQAYKKLIDLYTNQQTGIPPGIRPLLAITYFQLGSIASEQDKVQDARTFYHKATYLYEQLMERQPKAFLPYFASVQNNLGVINRLEGYLSEAKKNLQRTMAAYQELAQDDPENFLPYYANSLNSLGNIYADSWTPEDDIFSGNRGFLSGSGLFGSEEKPREEKDKEQAEAYYRQALDIFQQLADRAPDTYSHYVGTTYHNLGVLFDESKDFEQAEHYYREALGLRQKLAQLEPQAFDLDVCSTLLNLVTMYQTMMEQNVDISLRDTCLEWLPDIRKRLENYTGGSVPKAVENMKGDLDYFTQYFTQIQEIDLVNKDLKRKVEHLHEELLSTLDPEEKRYYYHKILALYQAALEEYPAQTEWTNAYNEYKQEAAGLAPQTAKE
jgi:tetratricopeptide (TPR) repeat protein